MSEEQEEARTPSYSESIARLRALIAQLESSQVDVDVLEPVVKEAVELVTRCRERLRVTQATVDTLLSCLTESTPRNLPSTVPSTTVP